MLVTKRNGTKQEFDINKIRKIINEACDGTSINPIELESKFSVNIKSGIKTSDIQSEIVRIASSQATPNDPEWVIVAGRLCMHDLHRSVYKRTNIDYETPFSKVVSYFTKNGYYDKTIHKFYTDEQLDKLTQHINKKCDRDVTIGSVRALINKYLIKNEKGIIELPQHANMAICLYLNRYEDESIRLKKIIEQYKLISNGYVSLATPFRANLRKNDSNLSSCFILHMDDNLQSITKVIKDSSLISSAGGGEAIYFSPLRPSDSLVGGIPAGNIINTWIKIFDSLASAVNQKGIRKAGISPSLDVWHKDILHFIEMKEEVGDFRLKCFDLFPQVLINDIFIKKIRENGEWFLLDHYEVRQKLGIDLIVPHALEDNFSKIEEAVNNGKIKNLHRIQAKDLWRKILQAYVSTGDLYIVHKDNMNRMNPVYDTQAFIQSANLCLHPETELTLSYDKGTSIFSKTIEEAYNLLRTNPELKIYIRSYDLKEDKAVFKPVLDIIATSNSVEYFELEDFEGNIIRATGNHKLFILDTDTHTVERLSITEAYDRMHQLVDNKTLITYSAGRISKTIVRRIKPCKLDKAKIFYDVNVDQAEDIDTNRSFFANNILVHNCVESFSPIAPATDFNTKIDENGRVSDSYNVGLTHVCNLISINMANILNNQELLEKSVRCSVDMLNKAIKCSTAPTIDAQRHNEKYSVIGIGLLGCHDYLAYNKLTYHKPEAIDALEKVIEKVSYYALDESSNLSVTMGSFEEFNNSYFKKGYYLGKSGEELSAQSINGLDWVSLLDKVKNTGLRNMMLLALAPNTSTGILQSSSASYLPIFSKFYYDSSSNSNTPFAAKFLKDRFWYYNESWTIDPRNIMELTTRMQKWVDAGMSMEMVINPSVEEISNIGNISSKMLECFERGLKAVYYCRVVNAGGDTEGNKETGCVSCAN